MTSDQIRTHVNNVLRTAAQLSRGTSTLPSYVNDWKQARGVRMAPLNDWIVESDRFDVSIASAYSSVVPGTMRKLISPTGRGKSTYMPGKIASLNGVSTMVLVPEDRHVATLHAFLVDYFPEKGLDVTPLPLSADFAINPPFGNNVYYCTSGKLLSVLSAHPDLFSTLKVDFIIVDEYHKIIGSNLAFYILLQAHKELSNLRVLAATATGPSDVNMKVKVHELKTVSVKSNLLTLTDPGATSVASPLHYSRIINKTMIFLPDDESIALWSDYYQDYDIPIVIYGFLSSSKQLNVVNRMLQENPLIVLLVTQVAETTFTFDVDTVIDTGQYVRVVNDYGACKSALKRLPVSKSMRVQRAGRVARFKPGTSYYFEADLGPEIDETDWDVCFEVYLWMKIFNVSLKDPLYTRFAGLGEISPMKAAILLHSRIPPFLLFPYVANDGFFAGWHKSMKQVLFTDVQLCSELNNDENVDKKWQFYVARAFGDLLQPIQYKARIEFPDEWQILPALAYQVYMGADEHGQVATYAARSIATAIEYGRRERPTSLDAANFNVVLSDHDEFDMLEDEYGDAVRLSSKLKPAIRPYKNESLVTDFDNMRVTSRKDKRKAVMSMQSEVFPQMNYGDIDFARTKLPPEQHDKVYAWAKTLSEANTEKPALVYDVSSKTPTVKSGEEVSDMSAKYTLMNLQPIEPDATVYRYHTFYPVSKDLFKAFMSKSQKPTMKDVYRVKSMANVRVNIGTMHETKLHKYFFSTIRVHNSATFKYLQLAGRDSAADGIFERITMFDANVDRREAKAEVVGACGLLRVFVNRACLVGVNRAFLKSDYPDDDSSSAGDVLLEEYTNTPTYANGLQLALLGLDMGNQTCRDRVEQYAKHVVPHKVFGRLISNMWAFSAYVFSVEHALVPAMQARAKYDDKAFLPAEVNEIHKKLSSLDIVIFSSNISMEVPYVREPKNGEDVFVMFWVEPQKKLFTVGGVNIQCDGDDVFITDNFHKGSSGALIVSALDGALLGFYTSQVLDFGVVSLAVKVFADLL